MATVPIPEELREIRSLELQEVRALHEGGALGFQVSAALTDLSDRIVIRAFEDAIEKLPPGDRERA